MSSISMAGMVSRLADLGGGSVDSASSSVPYFTETNVMAPKYLVTNSTIADAAAFPAWEANGEDFGDVWDNGKFIYNYQFDDFTNKSMFQYDEASNRLYTNVVSAAAYSCIGNALLAGNFDIEVILRDISTGLPFDNSGEQDTSGNGRVGLILAHVGNETDGWSMLTYEFHPTSAVGGVPSETIWEHMLVLTKGGVDPDVRTILASSGLLDPNTAVVYRTWSLLPTGVRVNVKRHGSTLTCQANYITDATTPARTMPYDTAHNLTFDLSSNPDTVTLQENMLLGYTVNAVNWASWDVVKNPTPNPSGVFMDQSTTEFYSMVNGAMTPTGESALKGLFYHDDTTAKLYYATDDATLKGMK